MVIVTWLIYEARSSRNWEFNSLGILKVASLSLKMLLKVNDTCINIYENLRVWKPFENTHGLSKFDSCLSKNFVWNFERFQRFCVLRGLRDFVFWEVCESCLETKIFLRRDRREIRLEIYFFFARNLEKFAKITKEGKRKHFVNVINFDSWFFHDFVWNFE